MTVAGDVDVCIIGGAGHVGLPLALVFARAAACPSSSMWLASWIERREDCF